MKIIDFHTHLSKYDQRGPIKSARAKDLLRYMEKYNVEKAVVLASYFPHHKYKKNGMTNDDLLKRVSGKDRLIPFGSLNMEEFSKGGYDLERMIVDKEIYGVKLYPGYQHFYPDDLKEFGMFYQLCEHQNVPVLLHSGSSNGKGSLLKYSMPILLDEVALEFPKLKIVIAHMGNPFFDQTKELVHRHDNVYTDLSGLFFSGRKSIEKQIEYYRPKLLDFIDYVNAVDKILYGSDFPVETMEDSIAIVKSLGLTKKEEEKVFYKNAERLLKNKVFGTSSQSSEVLK
ncbi:amidohydrolase family protein [Nanoarchaeota archaeon]